MYLFVRPTCERDKVKEHPYAANYCVCHLAFVVNSAVWGQHLFCPKAENILILLTCLVRVSSCFLAFLGPVFCLEWPQTDATIVLTTQSQVVEVGQAIGG